jgi:glycosyltransferase involved in cell wall biosynthesis
MRLAYVSPLPPVASGIADYSAELLPRLAARPEIAEIGLFVESGAPRPADPRLASFAVHPLASLARQLADGRFDLPLFHLGNNHEFHTEIRAALLAISGVTVLHEFVLHQLVRDACLRRGDLAGYCEELRYAYGRTGEMVGRRLAESGVPVDPWSFPLFERVVDASRALIVHNETTKRRVLESRPLARLTVVPHHLSLDALGADLPTPAAARAELGLPGDAFLVATFGLVTPSKRPAVLLEAFARLRATQSRARLLLVGEVSPYLDLEALLRPQWAAGVTVVGRTDLREFLLYMLAADVAVNLRHPSAGETSGTLMRLLGLGKAVVVTNEGSFAEIPDGCAAKVDLDEYEVPLLAATLERLAADPELRREMGANARRHMRAHHTLDGAAAAYAKVLADTLAHHHQAFAAAPPLLAGRGDDILSELVHEVAIAAHDLGVTEVDDDLLAAVAGVVDDVGLGEAR